MWHTSLDDCDIPTGVNPDCGGSTGRAPDVAWETKKHHKQGGPSQSYGEGIPGDPILKYPAKALGIPFSKTLIQGSQIGGGE